MKFVNWSLITRHEAEFVVFFGRTAWARRSQLWQRPWITGLS